MQLTGSVLHDLLVVLARLNVDGRLIATWLPAKAVLAFTTSQPLSESKVIATHAGRRSIETTLNNFQVMSITGMLRPVQFFVKYGGAT